MIRKDACRYPKIKNKDLPHGKLFGIRHRGPHLILSQDRHMFSRAWHVTSQTRTFDPSRPSYNIEKDYKIVVSRQKWLYLSKLFDFLLCKLFYSDTVLKRLKH